MSGFGHIDITAAVTYNEQNSPAAGCVSLQVAGVFDMMLDVVDLQLYSNIQNIQTVTPLHQVICVIHAYKCI